SASAENFPKWPHGNGWINGRIARDAAEIRIRLAGHAANLVDDPFGSKAECLAGRSPHHGAKRQNPLVDGQQVHYITRLLTAISRRHFVGGEVNRVEDIAESLIPHGGKETEVAVGNPFQLCGFTGSLGKDRVDARARSEPF